jgi:hypothetical protein
MRNLFDVARVEEVKQRIARLRPESERQWGTKNASQMPQVVKSKSLSRIELHAGLECSGPQVISHDHVTDARAPPLRFRRRKHPISGLTICFEHGGRSESNNFRIWRQQLGGEVTRKDLFIRATDNYMV